MSFAVWVTSADQDAAETTADEIARRLAARHIPVEVLDTRTPGVDALAGDERRAAFVAATLARHGVATVVALPAPTRAARARVRAELPRMIEVHVRQTAGAPAYEPPDRPEVEIEDASGVEQVVATLEILGLLARGPERGYSDDEEREVIRRLKAFGYL